MLSPISVVNHNWLPVGWFLYLSYIQQCDLGRGLTWYVCAPCFPVNTTQQHITQDVWLVLFRSSDIRPSAVPPVSVVVLFVHPCHTFYYLSRFQNRVLIQSQQLAAAPSVKSRMVTQNVIVLTATIIKRANASTSTNVDKERVCSIFVLRLLLTCVRVGHNMGHKRELLFLSSV